MNVDDMSVAGSIAREKVAVTPDVRETYPVPSSGVLAVTVGAGAVEKLQETGAASGVPSCARIVVSRLTVKVAPPGSAWDGPRRPRFCVET